MLEAHIEVKKELAVKGWRRAMRFKAMRDISYFYAVRLTIVWLVIATANAIKDYEELTTFHLKVLILVWIIASAVRYIKWYSEVDEKTASWEFDARLDEAGVSTWQQSEVRREWSFYTGYKEYEDYLEIEDETGNITFLPKAPQLHDVIEFTKQHIPSKQ